REAWLNELRNDPPFLYHPPSIPPAGPSCKRYLVELAALAASRVPDSIGRLHAIRSSLKISSYFLRSPVDSVVNDFETRLIDQIFAAELDRPLSSEMLGRLVFLLEHDHVTDLPITCLFQDASIRGSDEVACLIRSGDRLVSFTTAGSTIDVLASCSIRDAKVVKIAGYVRNDCAVTFPDGTTLELTGHTLRGYESTFAALLDVMP
ncbi:MAG: hypothetical protein AAGJ83_11455, partial [Planctomycetota bacterium]